LKTLHQFNSANFSLVESKYPNPNIKLKANSWLIAEEIDACQIF
jgi:hypothetical protein